MIPTRLAVDSTVASASDACSRNPPSCSTRACSTESAMARSRRVRRTDYGRIGRWLDPAADAGELQALLGPFPADQMEAYAVSPLVNSPRNDAPDCIAPVGNLH